MNIINMHVLTWLFFNYRKINILAKMMIGTTSSVTNGHKTIKNSTEIEATESKKMNCIKVRSSLLIYTCVLFISTPIATK